MNTRNSSAQLLRFSLLIAALAAASVTQAEAVRTQTLQLRRGWNAVFLEVYPVDTTPETVFTNSPIDIAASCYTPGNSAQFLADPGVSLFKVAGWGVWYAENRPDAFLKSLHSINGQQPYLIHCKTDYTWQVTGMVAPAEIRWQPNAHNLVGFCVADRTAPTFAQFFAASEAHRQSLVYRLADGVWRPILNPAAETMRSGEAFWIYCQGRSTYQGPLSVESATRQGLLLVKGTAVLTLRNQTDHPITPTVEHVVVGANSVPLAIVVRAVNYTNAQIQAVAVPQPAGAWTLPLPPLEAGQTIGVPLEARLQEMTSPSQFSLLKVSTDMGTEVWVPVQAIRDDLKTD